MAEGHGLEVHRAAVGQADSLAHGHTVDVAILAAVDIHGEAYAVDGEVGHIGGIFGGAEGRQVYVRRDRCSVEGPADEVVVDLGGDA